MRLYLGLVHYPVYNKNYKKIASAITTIDLHDLARLAKTYNAKKFFVITPLTDQQVLAERVRGHWTKGYGAKYNSHRKEAVELIHVVPDIEGAIGAVRHMEGKAPLLIATDASKQERNSISYEKARRVMEEEVILLIFGTAWGLEKSVIAAADYVLDPILGRSDYNHLSVRAAAAIVLDRLAGR
jgi:hypothetical protein